MSLKEFAAMAQEKGALTNRKKAHQIGELEELVLRSILFLNNDAYGIEMRDALEERAKRSVTFGTIYATLDRLQDKGMVTSRLGESSPEAGGRAKRYYQVTADGISAIQKAEEARLALMPAHGFAVST